MRHILLLVLALCLCIEWGPLTNERQKWGLAAGDPFVREVALTFDDGPREHGIQELLTILNQEKAGGTFFLVGKFAERYADITKLIAEQGQEIENHSYTHPKLYQLWVEKIVKETFRCNEVIERLGIKRPRFMRPPGGKFNIKVLNAMRRMDMKLGLWIVNSADYTGKTADRIAEDVIRRVSPGSIVLMHSGVPNTVSALPVIIQKLREQGYRFVKMEELWTRGRI